MSESEEPDLDALALRLAFARGRLALKLSETRQRSVAACRAAKEVQAFCGCSWRTAWAAVKAAGRDDS